MPPLTLATTEWGAGPRRALVMHGIGSNAAGWWRLGPDLADLGYRVVAPDLRGHGASPKAASMLIDEYRDDVLELGTGWDLVLGHSLGGAIALAANAAVSGWTDQLILQDPAIIGSNSPEVVAWLLSEYGEPITDEAIAQSNPHWHPTDAAIKAEALRQAGPEVVHRTIGEGASWNYWSELVAVTVPTLLIGADPEMGALVGPEIGAAAVQENPHIRFETVVGGSHSMHRDEYDPYWELVRGFAA
jgi:pimeloyl-ACP methyl ester carboxylesterase